MKVTRHFLGWDEPLTTKVRRFLVHDDPPPIVDLQDVFIVAPTAHAGRRLKEALALYCSSKNASLLSAEVVTPSFFFRNDTESLNEASQPVIRALWAKLLVSLELTQFPSFFSAKSYEQDFFWGMRTGEMIQNLRSTISDGGFTIAKLAAEKGAELEEADRWKDLAAIEKLFLAALKEMKLADPLESKIARAAEPVLPPSAKRVIIACVPDPSLLAIKALECISRKIPVDVLVSAPESCTNLFDEWGRPVTEKWKDGLVEFADAQRDIILAGSPSSQSEKAIEQIAAVQSSFGPADIAVGVPDISVAPFLETHLMERGIKAFNPAEILLSSHPVYTLIECYSQLVTEGSYDALRSFLRHTAVLDFLSDTENVTAVKLLTELDEFQNQFMPAAVEDMFAGLSGKENEDFESAAKAVAYVSRLIAEFRKTAPVTALRAFLQEIYDRRKLDPENTADAEFEEAAGLADECIREVEDSSFLQIGLDGRQVMQILLESMAGRKYQPGREDSEIDLEGWLELPWNNASVLIVTGMNEGIVPETRVSDVFLPDSLRSKLQLRDAAARFARDIFLMRILVESRRKEGRTSFICGKTTVSGDPLMPSRLLFRCVDSDLPSRAAALFGKFNESRHAPHSSVTFLLNPVPPADVPEEDLNIKRMSVTSFRSYLDCPFRFYLKYVLGMGPLDDLKREMDGMDFGTMVHTALQHMTMDGRMKKSSDPAALFKFLSGEVDKWMSARFRSPLSLPLVIAAESAKQRLRRFSEVQARLVTEGWETIETEKKFRMEMHGITVTGKIDRIDRNSGTGVLRVIDYKTSDKGDGPEKTHLGAVRDCTPDWAKVTADDKEKRWMDLQLPLYALMLDREKGESSKIEAAYINLPKAVSDTGVLAWESMHPALLESAENCAGQVIKSVKEFRFWPPSSRTLYDDEFAQLFMDDVENCVDVKAFEKFLDKMRKTAS
jgi:ATP-dependent helicase/nuclease subunit B